MRLFVGGGTKDARRECEWWPDFDLNGELKADGVDFTGVAVAVIVAVSTMAKIGKGNGSCQREVGLVWAGEVGSVWVELSGVGFS